ncbi:MAG: aldo/keto reductase [Deltaproteobacteria bacterium]|nr:aldo/keto reductase [Deltaproteobacteria bacterium]
MLTETLKKYGRVGLGGEGILRTHASTARAREVIQAAIDCGIMYFDSARVYSDSEVYYGTIWKESPETRAGIFQASKSASRDREGALKDLEETLGRMGTDYLDLWQIHDVRTKGDLEVISGPGGALEAFLDARSSGKVRFIGVTGHHDPGVLTQAVNDWPVDAVMMPVNPAEEVIGGFLTSTLSAARSKEVAVIGMKIMGGSHYVHLTHRVTPELLVRYALSRDVNMAIVGCSTAEEVKTLADTGSAFKSLSDSEASRLVQVFEPHAGRLAYYRGVI